MLVYYHMEIYTVHIILVVYKELSPFFSGSYSLHMASTGVSFTKLQRMWGGDVCFCINTTFNYKTFDVKIGLNESIPKWCMNLTN